MEGLSNEFCVAFDTGHHVSMWQVHRVLEVFELIREPLEECPQAARPKPITRQRRDKETRGRYRAVGKPSKAEDVCFLFILLDVFGLIAVNEDGHAPGV